MCNVVWLGDSDSDDGSGRDQERYLLQAIFAVCNLMADAITVEWIRKVNISDMGTLFGSWRTGKSSGRPE